jgi:hypothetical protein
MEASGKQVQVMDLGNCALQRIAAMAEHDEGELFYELFGIQAEMPIGFEFNEWNLPRMWLAREPGAGSGERGAGIKRAGSRDCRKKSRNR